ncbi:MAG TPA: TonB-dependent receptor [Methylophaga aminisulfidivorans]|uniref:TonB-dependent receptor n=1 Tax=Methylophaga TaxID=40222 RepID=UPI001765218A|nr:MULTISPECIES: TonB-dependent receptor [Methylophaga]HIC47321.1 TonB-dependent receptor [Methylophaga sp.]HIM38398.1 TonB-dependent receptor [Methylophaga aminisulfidivorans]
MKRTSLSLSIMLSLFLPSLAYAEHKHDVEELEKVTVSGQAIQPLPQDSAGLDLEALKSKRAQSSDTASLLKGIPGVSLYGAGGVSSLPVIHGLADDRLRIKVDGMDLISACANHMNPPLSYIAPNNIAELKVYSGITPVSAGGDSIGGTIIVKSKQPEFAKDADSVLSKGEIGAFYRSNGHARGANLSTTLATESFSLNYTGSTSKANNYDAADSFKTAGPAASDRGWLDGDEVGSTAYETRNHALNLGFKLDNHLLQLKLAHQDIPYQGFPNQRMDMTENRSNQVNLIYNGLFDWGSLEASVYREKTHHKMQFGDDKQFLYGTDALGMPMETEGRNTGVSLKTEVMLNDRDLLRVGTEIQKYRLDDFWEASGSTGMMQPNTFENINNGQRDRYAIYTEWEANWTSKWTTLAGIRHETVKMNADNVQGYNTTNYNPTDFNNADKSKTDNNLDLTLMGRFTPSDNASYEFGYAQKTRSPNLYERYAWSTNGMAMRMVNLVGDGNGYVGNVDLEPEIAHTISFTADWHDADKQDWNVTFTPYVSYVDDFIDAKRCSGGTGMSACTTANLSATDNFVYLQYDNVSAKLYGADLSLAKHLYHDDQIGHISGQAVFSYVRGKNRDTGDNLYNIMPLNATFTLQHAKGAWHNTAEWQVVAAKDQVNDERNEQETAGYGLLNLRTSYEWKQARVDFGIDNVLDKAYSEPLSGAYTGQGMTMSGSGVPWGVTVPGMGRSFYTAVSYSF